MISRVRDKFELQKKALTKVSKELFYCHWKNIALAHLCSTFSLSPNL
jgi:hypothetical protein